MPLRNNVTRLLDSHKIEYELYEFDAQRHSAEEVAEHLGVPAGHVFKTLVVLREGHGRKPVLVIAPGGRDVDLKALAASAGEKKLRMAPQQQAEALTGLQVGGISPLALLNLGFDVYISRAALDLTHVYVSAGVRGANLHIAVSDLIALTGARPVDTS